MKLLSFLLSLFFLNLSVAEDSTQRPIDLNEKSLKTKMEVLNYMYFDDFFDVNASYQSILGYHSGSNHHILAVDSKIHNDVKGKALEDVANKIAENLEQVGVSANHTLGGGEGRFVLGDPKIIREGLSRGIIAYVLGEKKGKSSVEDFVPGYEIQVRLNVRHVLHDYFSGVLVQQSVDEIFEDKYDIFNEVNQGGFGRTNRVESITVLAINKRDPKKSKTLLTTEVNSDEKFIFDHLMAGLKEADEFLEIVDLFNALQVLINWRGKFAEQDANPSTLDDIRRGVKRSIFHGEKEDFYYKQVCEVLPTKINTFLQLDDMTPLVQRFFNLDSLDGMGGVCRDLFIDKLHQPLFDRSESFQIKLLMAKEIVDERYDNDPDLYNILSQGLTYERDRTINVLAAYGLSSIAYDKETGSFKPVFQLTPDQRWKIFNLVDGLFFADWHHWYTERIIGHMYYHFAPDDRHIITSVEELIVEVENRKARAEQFGTGFMYKTKLYHLRRIHDLLFNF